MRNIFASLFPISLLILLLSCNRGVVTVYTEVPVLKASSIYEDDSVYHFMERYKDTNKDIAASYYKRGLDLENTNLAKAIYCVKRSITLQPELSKYKILASLLLKSGAYPELNRLYYTILYPMHFGEDEHKYLFGKPDEDMVYEYVIFNIIAYKNAWGGDGDYTELTTELGIDVKDLEKKVLSDKRLKFDTSTEEYKDLLLQFLSEDEMEKFMKTESSFKTFLTTIKDTASVFEINKDSVAEFNYARFHDQGEAGPEEISMDNLASVYLKESYNKRAWLDYNYKHRCKINDSVNAVLYSVDSSEIACPRDMRCVYYRLVTYGKKANIISDMVVANQAGEQLSTVKYNHGIITVTYYKRTWEKPFVKSDFDNHLKSIDKVEEKIFQIKQDGTFAMVTPTGA